MSSKMELAFAVGFVTTRTGSAIAVGHRLGCGGRALLIGRRVVGLVAASVVAALGHPFRIWIVAIVRHVGAGFEAFFAGFVGLAHDASPWQKLHRKPRRLGRG